MADTSLPEGTLILPAHNVAQEQNLHTTTNFFHRVGRVVTSTIGHLAESLLALASAITWASLVLMLAGFCLWTEFREWMEIRDTVSTLQFLVRYGYPAIFAMILANTLSASISNNGVSTMDFVVTVLGTVALAVVLIAIGLYDKGVVDFTYDDKMFIFFAMMAGVIDLLGNQLALKKYRAQRRAAYMLEASSKEAKAAMERGVAAVAPAAHRPYHALVRIMDAHNLLELGPVNGVKFVKDGDTLGVIIEDGQELFPGYRVGAK